MWTAPTSRPQTSRTEPITVIPRGGEGHRVRPAILAQVGTLGHDPPHAHKRRTPQAGNSDPTGSSRRHQQTFDSAERARLAGRTGIDRPINSWRSHTKAICRGEGGHPRQYLYQYNHNKRPPILINSQYHRRNDLYRVVFTSSHRPYILVVFRKLWHCPPGGAMI